MVIFLNSKMVRIYLISIFLCIFNSPCVLANFEIIKVKESIPVGNKIHKLPTPDANLEYSVYQWGDPEGLSSLTVTPSGEIILKTALNYQIGEDNSFQIIAILRSKYKKYGGMPYIRKFEIIDTNNHSPTFAKKKYEGSIQEGLPAGSIVMGLEDCFATDLDSSGIVGYSITEGNNKKQFVLDTRDVKGIKLLIVKTTGTIDRDLIRASPYLDLEVEARDGGNEDDKKFAKTVIRINILDVNDNPPVFLYPTWRASIQENSMVMSSVMKISATDNDEGPNAEIYYYFKEQTDDFFINPSTGEIHVASNQNVDVKNSYDLTVIAQDKSISSRKEAETSVSIQVLNVANYPPTNLNNVAYMAPKFKKSQFKVTIRGDLPVKSFVFFSQLINTDIYKSDNLKFKLSGDRAYMFHVSQKSGVVILAESLNPSRDDNYLLDLSVEDSKGASIQAKVVVKVQPLNLNQYSPVFSLSTVNLMISEDTREKTNIYNVQATDSDTGKDGQVSYKIIEGSGIGVFNVKKDTGVLTNTVKFKGPGVFDLKIQAEDNGYYKRYGYMYIRITILQAYNNAPLLSRAMYVGPIYEEEVQDSFVAAVFAKSTIQNRKIIYEMSGDKIPQGLALDRDTGIITTTLPFDYEETKSTNMEVSVKIQGVSKITKTLVKVIIVNINDNQPVFTRASITTYVKENSGDIPSLVCLFATDSDGSGGQSTVKYSITNGNIGNVFSVDSQTGQLSVKNLDYESHKNYNLHVTATDGKNDAKATVNVVVIDTDDPPHFDQSVYTASIMEGSISNTVVKELDITSTASNSHTCKWNFDTSLEVLSLFTLKKDLKSCIVVVKEGSEIVWSKEQSKYQAVINAINLNKPTEFSSAKITITVQDTNNHSPSFSQTSYAVSLKESIKIGDAVTQVQATDEDDGMNGRVAYSIKDGADSSLFEIKADGNIIVKSSLEKNRQYVLTVSARDQGSPPLISSVKVFISIHDATTVIPKFSSDISQQILSEDAPLGFIASIAASGNNLKYELVGGNDEKLFTITTDGNLRLTERLDYEKRTQHKLVVRVTEVGLPSRYAQMKYTINVADVNDHSPIFAVVDPTKPMLIYINKNAPDGAVVHKVKAYDMDSGNNGKVSYMINEGWVPFQIDDTGTITTIRPMTTYDIGDKIDFKIRAMDNNPNSKSSVLSVSAQVQDGVAPPVFTQQLYTAALPDNVAIGTNVVEVKTNDNDRMSTATFKVTNGNENHTFCIDSTKTLYVQKPMDFDLYHMESQTLSIEMTNGYQTTKTSVKITMSDENDNSPVFVNGVGPIVIEVSERKPALSIIYTSTATDDDTGSNGKVTYSIVQVISKSATQSSLFNIDPFEGKLSINEKLDFELCDQHRVFIKAQDDGTLQRRYTLQELVINVIDENDELPTFSETEYIGYIDTNAKPGDHAITVFASDFDSGKYGKVTYEIIGNDYDSTFSIGATSGLITLLKPIALLNTQKFELSIRAQDIELGAQGRVTLIAVTKEGPPKFALSKFTFNQMENRDVNLEIGRAKATSLDLLKYTIIRGNENETFFIESNSGKIYSREILDAERKRQYVLYVRATDLSERFAEASVEINILNVNDNGPMFKAGAAGLIEAVVPRDASIGSKVVDVEGYDLDIDDKLTYSINTGSARPYFQIDNKGIIRTIKSLQDLSPGSNVNEFEVVAKDIDNKQSKVQVRVVLVNYKPRTIERYVSENREVSDGWFIKEEYALGNQYPTGKFRIVYPSVNPFSIDGRTGYIGLKEKIDYEQIKEYHIVVEEVNQNIVNEYINYDVKIIVTDANDNSPTFTMLDFMGKVNKNANPGTRIIKLSADDPDSGDAGNVDFEIKTQSVPFSIDPETNEITTSSYSITEDWYNISVIASDRGIPPKSSQPITVYIKTGDNPPEFGKSIYRFEISENSQSGKVIGQVSAYSLSGLPIKYSIVGGDQQNAFVIDSQGRILSQGNLDFESGRSQYSLTVEASEINTQPLTSTCNVVIKIVNVNDNIPEFTLVEYRSPSIMENVRIGTTLVKVTATDCDCSETCQCAGGLLIYSLKSYQDTFEIDHVSGAIRNIRALDYDTISEYRFQVQVQDSGDQPQYGVADVVITLADENDNAPSFTPAFAVVSVAENIRAGTIIRTVQAQDADGDPITYKIASGDKTLFEIGEKTGVVKVNPSKDPTFLKDEYMLNITASDELNEGYYQLKIMIEDINDNSPVFESCNTYQPVVMEQSPVNTEVIRVSAVDTDRGRNGEIEYEIQEPQKTGREFFSASDFKIDNTTGVIQSNKVFDREIKSSYIVLVVAKDGGHARSAAERNSASCQLEIQVTDINDHTPIFSVQKYDISIAENTDINTVVLEVSAQDRDEGTNAAVKYSIKQSLLTPQFAIDEKTGAISVAASLIGLQQSLYSFTVQATDSADSPRFSTIEVDISVRPSNPPKFSQQNYRTSLREDTKPGAVVTEIQAISQAKDDEDKKIYYSILPGNLPSTNKPPTFTVDSATGEIRVGKVLDYEMLKEYVLTIGAVDKSGLKSNVKLYIFIEDVNDNTPLFVLSNYILGNVAEGKPAGQIVETVNATDADSGNAGTVRYSLEESDESKYFSINPVTGIIRTKVVFDREKTPKVTFNVKAEDQVAVLKDRLSSVVYVSIQITDVNDNPPSFEKARYEEVIEENSKVGSDVLEIKATDADAGGNSKLNYYIVSGNDKGYFGTRSIHRADGESVGYITIERVLDREDQDEFEMKLTASDSQYNAFTYVNIKVEDVNDNDPIFKVSFYNATIPEDTRDGVFVTEVKATDKDTDAVQESITYKLAQETIGYFVIDTNTGIISTGKKGFDRETKSIYTFLVFASDGVRTGSASVKVFISDINDEKPEFLNGPYERTVEEKQKSGAVVGFVTASDKDIGSNAMIIYSLKQDAGRFSIEGNTGLIRTSVVLDRESKENVFTIIVVATDQGKNSLQGSTEVTIVVKDANDQYPEFLQDRFLTTMKECSPIGSRVTQVQATDKDEGLNAELSYSITQGNTPRRFRIDPESGRITVAHRLDFEKEKGYELIVSVRDKGLPQLISKQVVKVNITVEDCNDNLPIFSEPSYTVQIREDSLIGTVVIKVTASDKDTGAFQNFVFGIVEPDENYQFIIRTEGTTGTVLLDWVLDREKQPQHIFKIFARDTSGDKSLTGYAQLTVDVIDVNDNGPIFKTPDFCGSVMENMQKVQEVATIEVSDPDETGRCPCTFKIVDDPSNLFIIEATANGNIAKIKTKSDFMFDRDEKDKQIYKVRVSATDSGTPMQTSFTYVYVEVGDKNDNIPESGGMSKILVNAYKGEFTSGAIGKVYVIDKDRGTNDRYSHVITNRGGELLKKFMVNNQGMVSVKTPLAMTTYNFEVESTERNGRGKVVTSNVDINVRGISEQLVQSSIPIRMTGLTKSYTCKDLKYPEMEAVIAEALGVSTEQVIIFSYMNVPKLYRGVDVWFSVVKSKGMNINGGDVTYMRAIDMLVLLNRNKYIIEKKTGGKVMSIGIDACAKETCNAGFCYNDIHALTSSSIVTSDNGMVPPPAMTKSFVSMDVLMKAVCTSKPRVPESCLPNNPCRNLGSCISIQPAGFRCQCLEGYDGPRCEKTTRYIKEGGYFWLTPITYFFEGGLSFEFRTTNGNGLLMYHGPISKLSGSDVWDFVAVDLQQGNLRISVSQGEEKVFQKTLLQTNGGLNDGIFHHVEIIKRGKAIQVILDYCNNAEVFEGSDQLSNRDSCEISGTIPGRWRFINGIYPLQFGQWQLDITDNQNRYPNNIDFQSFSGCIRNIMDNGVMYDLKFPLVQQDSGLGCPALELQCPKCIHGICVTAMSPFKCSCDFGWKGDFCSLRVVAWRYLDESYSQFTLMSGYNTPKVLTWYDKYKSVYKLQFRTQDDGVILFEGATNQQFNNIDFSILEIKDKILQYRYNLGDGTQILMVSGVNVTDHAWHNLTLTRTGTQVVLELTSNNIVVAYVTRNQGTSQLLDTSTIIHVGGVPMKIKDRDVVGDDFKGCIANIQYKDVLLDDGDSYYVETKQQNVDTNCTCTSADAAVCLNGASCLAGSPPICLCGIGWTGANCAQPLKDDLFTGRNPPTPGILMLMVLLVSLFLIVTALLALFASGVCKKTKSVPVYVDADGYGNIMPYNDEGAGEDDFHNYDLEKLLQHAGGKGLTLSSRYANGYAGGKGGAMVNGGSGYGMTDGSGEKEGLIHSDAIFHTQATIETNRTQTQASNFTSQMSHMMSSNKAQESMFISNMAEAMNRDSIDIASFIESRLEEANADDSILPRDTLLHYGYEGDGSDVDDLSELNESDDELGSEDEDDYTYMEGFGPKFDKLNLMLNPQFYDDETDDDV